jgi:hypothetical protein
MSVYQTEITTTIAINTAASAAIPLMGQRLLGIYMPAAWTAAAVKLAFNVHPGTGVNGAEAPAYDDAGWYPVTTIAGALKLAVLHATPTGKYIQFGADDIISGRFLQIVGTDAAGTTPIVQTAARTLRLVVGESMS